MVSKARLDLPLPLGPVITVSFPSGRSRSIPLRLFWRAPRISTQPLSGGAVTQGFSAVVEPTEDYPIARTRLQMEHRLSACAESGHFVRVEQFQRVANPLAAQTASLCSVNSGRTGSRSYRARRGGAAAYRARACRRISPGLRAR